MEKKELKHNTKKAIILIGIIVLAVAIQVYSNKTVQTYQETNKTVKTTMHKEIEGFYSLNSHQNDWQKIRLDILSTLVLCSIRPTDSGGIDVSDSDIPADLIKMAHKNGVKVVISVQPKGTQITDAMLTTSKDNFLDNILDLLQRNNLDGIDIDIEDIGETNSITGDPNSVLMTNFMKDLSTKLWDSNRNYRISIDVPYSSMNKVFDLNTIQKYVSYVMVMEYDYHWYKGSTAGSVAPIDEYNSGESISKSIRYYSNIVDKNKLLLGVPWYGLEWKTDNGDIESQTIGRGKYYDYKTMDDRANKYGRIWDNTWKTPWYKYKYDGVWYQGHYDDIQSLSIKYDLVNSQELAGIGIWELGYGADELWQQIQDKLGEGNV